MASKANLKSSGREAALARRRAQSSEGKARTAAPSAASNPAPTPVGARVRPQPAAAPSAQMSPAPAPTAAASAWSERAVRPGSPSLRPEPQSQFQTQPQPRRNGAAPPSPSQSSRAAALARRKAQSSSGRRAVRSNDRVRDGRTDPKTAAMAPAKTDCTCGCNGERTAAAEPPRPLAPAPATTLSKPLSANGNGNGRSPRNKRAEAALAAKPTGRAVALARRHALSGRGKGAASAPRSAASLARTANPTLSGRELAQQVRALRSTNGGAGEQRSAPAGRVRSRNGSRAAADQPWKVGASETAAGQVVTGTRVGRSPKTTGDEPSTCRTITGTEYMGADIFRDFCQTEPSAPPAKVRVTATGHGNRVTGNEVGRSAKVTGDEPGTCTQVTGTEYLSPIQIGAFCATPARPEPGPRKVGIAETAGGHRVSGNLVGRSAKVTGDEHGAGVRPTGTQYTAPAEIGQGNGQARAAAAKPVPPKVGVVQTLAGGTVTGTRVGRSAKVTGDEPGSCRLVTGDEYLGASEYEGFCEVRPRPEAPKVGQSRTAKGQIVSGTQAGRSARVTGDEPGTCKTITGTPYAGLEQAADWCSPAQQRGIEARTRPLAMTAGPRLTGTQPGIDRADGGRLTGAGKGACEPITGTPYIGADQFAAACGGNGAQPGEADFPRAIDGGAPWQQFSVASPARQALDAARERSGVTGTVYESSRHITGPFGMGSGKITGTEQFRFDSRRPRPDLLTPAADAPVTVGEIAPAETNAAAPTPAPAPAPASAMARNAAPVRPRITGEGQTAGIKVTGDDWERGSNVTGTEGVSARRRNPTRPGLMGAMPAPERKRNDDVPAPVSRVTGSAGSTERGSLVTYSGGARG